MGENLQRQSAIMKEKILGSLKNEGVIPQTIPLNAPEIKEIKGAIETPAQKMMKGAHTVKTLTISDEFSKNEGKLLTLSIASNARRVNALKDISSLAEPQVSIDPSTAIEVEPDTVYQVGGFTENQQLLVKISTQGIGKLSSVIQFDAAVVVESLVFTLDETGSATVVADSVNMLSDFDIVSILPNGGVYYVLYMVYAGGGNAAIFLPKSSGASINEPNDSAFQAPLRHEECYIEDTFDNGYDTDVVRIQITNPEPVAISLTFGDTDYSGQINLGIYHKTDAEGNAVDQWLIYQSFDVPFYGVTWKNASAKGEFYIYVQYMSGNMLDRPYTFTFNPASRLQKPHYIKVGDNGIIGTQYGHKWDGTLRENIPWVIGTFKLIADVGQPSSQLVQTENGEYPYILSQLFLIGQDRDGNWDTANNSFFSKVVHSDKYGILTVGAVLPGSWGNDGYFSNSYYKRFDYNQIALFFLNYNKSTGLFEMKNFPKGEVYTTFDLFWNVEA